MVRAPGGRSPLAIAWLGAGSGGSLRSLGGAGGSGWIASGFQNQSRSPSSCHAPPAAIRSPSLALSPSAIRMPSAPLPSVSSISQTYGDGTSPASIAAAAPAGLAADPAAVATAEPVPGRTPDPAAIAAADPGATMAD